MAPATGTALLVLAAFVLPGFVALTYRERTYVVKTDDTPFERLLGALYYSFLSYLVLGFVAVIIGGASTHDISRLWHGKSSASTYVGLAAGGVVVPVVLAELARWWSASRLRDRVRAVAGVNTAHSTPSGWEHFFLADRTCFVRATLRDGRVLAGRYGDRSFAGYTAETPDLYLEQRWSLDDNDWFTEPVAGSLGVYIRARDIVSVEFYDDGVPRQPSLAWWRRLRYLLPNVRLPRYDLLDADAATTPDPQERRDQPVAEATEQPPDASSSS